MTACVHGKVCREYMRRYEKILCASCPDKCPYFEEQQDDGITLTAKQLGDVVTDALISAQRYHSRNYC